MGNHNINKSRNSVLWYTQPAKQWDHGMPIGNGRMGAMVMGGTASERIQLNEETVWSGGDNDKYNPAVSL